MIFTKCDNCVFATMTNNKQSGCNLNKADMLGIEEINENDAVVSETAETIVSKVLLIFSSSFKVGITITILFIKGST